MSEKIDGIIKLLQSTHREHLKEAFSMYEDNLSQNILLGLSSHSEYERSEFLYKSIRISLLCNETLLDVIQYKKESKFSVLIKSENARVNAYTEIDFTDKRGLKYLLACMLSADWHSEIPLSFFVTETDDAEITCEYAIDEQEQIIYSCPDLDIDFEEYESTRTEKFYTPEVHIGEELLAKLTLEIIDHNSVSQSVKPSFVFALLLRENIQWEDIPRIDSESEGYERMFNRLLSDHFTHIPTNAWKRN